jgi:hypothetical protein
MKLPNKSHIAAENPPILNDPNASNTRPLKRRAGNHLFGKRKRRKNTTEDSLNDSPSIY